MLFRVASYAAQKFHIGDIIFGIYHLAQHHATTDAVDDIKGREVTDVATIEWLAYCTDLATIAYCPTKQKICEAAGIRVGGFCNLRVFSPGMAAQAVTDSGCRSKVAAAWESSHGTCTLVLCSCNSPQQWPQCGKICMCLGATQLYCGTSFCHQLLPVLFYHGSVRNTALD